MSHHSHRRSRHRESSSENQDINSDSPGIINIITSTKTGINTFANDGSFLEMFKKKMEEEKNQSTDGISDCEKSNEDKGKKADTSTVKRRGGKILKTGMVKKQRVEDQDEDSAPANDAWSRYMAEVKKYRQQACDEDGKTRPLVK